jgi:hypothetical protein
VREESETDPQQLREEILFVRATQSEKQRIMARAQAANLSASRFLIRMATSERPPPTREERERLEELLLILKRSALHLHRLAENMSALRLAGAGEHVRQEFAQTARLLGDLIQSVRRRL